jgi:hypothetical protein
MKLFLGRRPGFSASSNGARNGRGNVLDSSAAVDGAEQSQGAGRYRKLIRGLVNVWLIFHLSAIAIAPASVSPSSALVQSAWRGVRQYLQLLYMNHGYHFFAPEPAQSTLVSYTLELEDGSEISGRFPHREIKPRLLYHRHFMLTEFLSFAQPEQRALWHRSYARQLCREHGAVRVSLSRVTHYLPTMEMIRDGGTLDDPASYAEQPLGTFQCDEL